MWSAFSPHGCISLLLQGTRYGLLALLLLTVPASAPALAQHPAGAASGQQEDASGTRKNPYGTGAGLGIVLTNSGFGVGAYYKHALTRSTSAIVELSAGAGKDEREFKFISYFGRSQIQNKANYLLMMPAQAGLQQRLFQDSIEDNFRPFLQVTGGPTLGWEYPYFKDLNGNGKLDASYFIDEDGDGIRDAKEAYERTYDAISALPRGSFRFGMGGLIALGAHFGMSKRMTQGIRLGYSFNYFFRGIELLEPDVPGGVQQFFGTPTISLTFGRLF